MKQKPDLKTVVLALETKLAEFEQLVDLLLAKKGDTIYECQRTYIQCNIDLLEACINGIVDDDLNEVELLEDGFGNACDLLCKECGSFMQIVRPGKFQCESCG